MKFPALRLTPIVFVVLAISLRAEETQSLEGYRRINNITYAEVNQHRLLLDLYLPTEVKNPPLVVWVHGGAWRRGSKASMPLIALVKSGWAVASVDYRLSPTAKFPAQIHDCKAAIRFLRASREKYGINTKRIAVAGSSAGGHLAALIGVTNHHKDLEGTVGEHLDQSSNVQAIVDYYGPTNFMTILKQSTPHGLSVRVPALELLLGAQPETQPELARLASAVFHVDPKDPPLLLIHGDQDPQVPINQSHELHGKYKDLKLPVRFEVVHGGFHGGKGFFDERRNGIVQKFLETHCLPEAKTSATLILLNGNLVTLDEKQPQAEAIAISGDRILALGKNSEILALAGPKTKTVDLKGRLTIPGFIEGHGHFLSLGRLKQQLDLTRAQSWEEIVQQVKVETKQKKRGDWILGRGWHQEKWIKTPENASHGYPVHESLSRNSPDHPVLLVHASGHACLANAKAMQLAGVKASTPDPAGGKILRNDEGQPIGVFRETAQALIGRAYDRDTASRSPAEDDAQKKAALQHAARECLSKGITSFQDAGSSFEDVDFFKEQAKAGRLPVRLWVMLRASNAEYREKLARYRTVNSEHSFLTVRAIKCMADGALGSHGALLLKPYRDLPESTGHRVQSLTTIQETALLAAKQDFQVCTHAIGDRANREILEIYQTQFRSHPNKTDWRWRIEHAQHLHPADIPRFGELGVIASMQTVHCTSDAPFVVERLGEQRAKAGAYAWRSLVDSGTKIVNGTDAPVEDVNPLGSFYAAITRHPSQGMPFYPEQCLTRMEALRSYTLDAAYAAFEDQQKGSLTPGKLADLVVLSHDILTIPANDILKTQVEMTIIGGKAVYQRKDP